MWGSQHYSCRRRAEVPWNLAPVSTIWYPLTSLYRLVSAIKLAYSIRSKNRFDMWFPERENRPQT